MKPIIPPLWEHQQEAIKKAVANKGRHAFFFDPGCGKTRTALELFNGYQARKVVIVAPLNVCRNWKNEIETFAPQIKKVFVVAGQTKIKKLKIIEAFNQCNNEISALIINMESFRGKEYVKELLHTRKDFWVIDESHNFKSATSQQTKGLIEVMEKVKPKHLYLLTGTPAPQGEIDLWSTFYLLNVTNQPFFIWRKIYFDDKNARRAGTQGYYPNWIVRKSSQVEFQELLRKCSSVAKKDEVLDLPELLRSKIYCQLSPQQRKHYETMFEFLFAIDTEGHELEASNMLSRTMRLQQIVAGMLGEVEIKDNPRLEALKFAVAKTQGEQFLVWTIFKNTYQQTGKVLDDLGISYAFLTGEQSAEERFQNMQDFQAGKLRALICHPRAGGVGVNLTAASYSIHYTKNYNLVDDLQCEARNYRGGSEIHKRITRIDIVAEDTIDEEITEALAAKKTIQDFILGLKESRTIGHCKASDQEIDEPRY